MGGGGFTFKQFHIDHSRCAMKVGTDGVLIGAWCRLPSSGRILDIGTGTGLIAVMVAQRASGCMVTGIDIDAECVAQARDNAASSPWGGRIGIEQCALQEFFPTHRFDAIVSNPPYFEESLLPHDARRTAARHTRSLTYAELVDGVVRLLDAEGRFSLILPAAESERFLSAAHGVLFLTRRCDVRTTLGSGVRRVMMEFAVSVPKLLPHIESLSIEDGGPMRYSGEYRALTRDFYLKF